ncbi:MAG TPA: LysM peptidoglycan-binding domain-containing protein [Opitutaceae bacterium]|nr:LysM peptidoglycan-binding domain-containing protein [Opitutaceae bacterium]
MDTISRENNSILPIAGVLVGVLALLLSGVALMKLSTANRSIEGLKESMTKVDSLESEVRNASNAADQAKSAADTANRNISSLQSSTQSAFTSVAAELTGLKGDIEKIHAPKGAAAAKGEKAQVVAGEGEYIIKSGDTGAKIARAHGASIEDLKSVNPGVNWNGLKIGQKIKLPVKKAPNT